MHYFPKLQELLGVGLVALDISNGLSTSSHHFFPNLQLQNSLFVVRVQKSQSSMPNLCVFLDCIGKILSNLGGNAFTK